jgi:hypothetical protein
LGIKQAYWFLSVDLPYFVRKTGLIADEFGIGGLFTSNFGGTHADLLCVIFEQLYAVNKNNRQ